MSTGSILFGAALLVIVVLFLARPFLLAPARERRLSRRQKLVQQKEALLEQIRALDFDHETGKEPTESYQPQRDYLVREAAAVMQALDAFSASTADEPRKDIDAKIEAAVARLRTRPAPAQTTQPTGGYCPQCGRPADAGDKFCAGCGHRLAEPQSAATS